MSRPGFNSFRKAQQRSQSRRGGGGGAKTPWQAWQFEMVPGDSGPIRFLPVDAFTLTTHNFPRDTCTAFWPGFELLDEEGEILRDEDGMQVPGKCVWCYYNERDKEFREKHYATTRTWMQLIDFRYRHWEKTMVKGKEKILVHTCSESEPNPRRNRCHHCNSTDPYIAERRFAGKVRWEMTDDQFAQVTDTYKKLRGICLAQPDPNDPDSVCEQKIYDVGYVCSNEECQAELITERQLETEDCNERINNPFECPECGNVDYPVAVLVCSSEDHEALPASLFDKILDVSCSGVTKQTQGGERTTKAYSFDTSKAPWSTLEDDLAFFGITGEKAQEMMTPESWVERFRPMWLKRNDFGSDEEYVEAVLKKQAEKAGKPVPPEWLGTGGGGNRSTGGRAWCGHR